MDAAAIHKYDPLQALTAGNSVELIYRMGTGRVGNCTCGACLR